MNLQSIRANVHHRLLKLRALDRLVDSRRFEVALKLADSEDPILLEALANTNPEALEAWMNMVLVKELDDMSARELRVRAAKLQIPFYTTYQKTALILKILEVQENARKAQEAALAVPSEEERPHAQSA